MESWTSLQPRYLGQHARQDPGDGRYAATAVMVETRREECTVGKIQVNDPIRPRELTMIQGEQITIPVPEFRTHLQFRRFAGYSGCNLHLRSIAKRHDEILGADLRTVVVFYRR
jgi:hypothetical protein